MVVGVVRQQLDQRQHILLAVAVAVMPNMVQLVQCLEHLMVVDVLSTMVIIVDQYPHQEIDQDILVLGHKMVRMVQVAVVVLEERILVVKEVLV
jgi:hypothetical protein